MTLITIDVCSLAANLFVDEFVRLGNVQRLSNAHRGLVKMARSTLRDV